jgi:hypothetical protein
MHACLLTLIKLTSATGGYTVIKIINRDRRMISIKTPLHFPLPDIRVYAKRSRITYCYTSDRLLNNSQY